MGIAQQANEILTGTENDVQEHHLVGNSSSESDVYSSGNSRAEARDRIITSGAPDGGWGWMIVFSVFMSTFLVDGIIGSFGIIYPELLRAFDAGPALTSLAGSIIVAMFLMSCPIAGVLLRRLGCRRVCLVGGVITASGFVLSSFSGDILTFIVTYGILGGTGIGMNYLAGNVLVNLYFEKRRGLACGIVSSGAGFGLFVLALTTEKLLQEFGWRGTMLLSAGIMLHFCVFACLLRPVENDVISGRRGEATVIESEGASDSSVTAQNTESFIKDDKEPGLREIDSHDVLMSSTIPRPPVPKDYSRSKKFLSLLNVSDGLRNPNSQLVSLPDISGSNESAVNVRYRNFGHKHESHMHRSLDPFLRKDIFYSSSLFHIREFKERSNTQTFVPSLRVVSSEEEESSEDSVEITAASLGPSRFCDLGLFKNAVYIPILVGAILLQMGQFIPSTFIPEYCKTLGLIGGDGSVIISIYGAVNIAGRLSAGCLANLRCVSPLWLCNFGAFMCAVCCALFPLCQTFSSLCIFAVGFGYFVGYSCPLQHIILVEYLGPSRLTAALSILQLFKGPAALAGPPLAGVVYEWAKDYRMTVLFAGALFLLAAVAQSMVPFTNRCFSGKTRLY